MVTVLEIGEVSVDVVFKDIKNVHLSVYPPTGRVRISAPRRMDLESIRLFAISKLGWIKRHQAKLLTQESPRVEGGGNPGCGALGAEPQS
jgi:predicted metal-dependent hydrolase